MSNLSTQIAEIALERQLNINRYIGSLQNDILVLFRELAQDIDRQIGAKPLTEYKAERLSRLVADIKAEIADLFDEQFDKTRESLIELAADEAKWAAAAINTAVGVDLVTVLAPKSVLREIVKKDLFQGALLDEWFKRQSGDTYIRIYDVIRTVVRVGVASGSVNAEIIRRIAGHENLDGSDVLSIKRRHLTSLVRTAVQTVSNRAAMATWESNPNVIKGVQQLSTLDGRTSDVCIAYSGKAWTLDEKKPIDHSLPWNGGPPRHFSCRSRTIPLMKSFAELGIDLPEMPKSTRSSMDGQVAEDLSFDDFLKKKGTAFQDATLGKGRAELWRDGKITLSQLLDQRGNPLTLAELQRIYD